MLEMEQARQEDQTRRATRALAIEPGDPLVLGMYEVAGGFNFAIFSRHATRLRLVLFGDGHEPVATITLDPERHRTGDIWHVRLIGDLCGLGYAFEAEGPWLPEEGHRFDPGKRLLDPYASGVAARADGSLVGLIADHRFDWQGDEPLRLPWRDTIIYETHVRGLTIHPSSSVRHPGQYLGVVEKIPYLRELGVTAVELLPVQEFQDFGSARQGVAPVREYWGYQPVAFFAPKSGYAGAAEAAGAEFKTMVRALHRAGIEVILDVVFNHTGEGDEAGPSISFRGLDNAIYYLLAADKRRYVDFTGCGNTLNCNHPVVRRLILDCLRHWAVRMHVDGFRFDLASILGRDQAGNLLQNPPLLEEIAEDTDLRHVKLIAEAWDLGGAFQVGSFPGRRWAEWNCHFRDDVRRFWRGDPGMTSAFATRLCGSADLYQSGGESPLNSVNFVTAHDGFTLEDLVSYARKHNEANGEGNRDGLGENFSENNGVEGPTEDAHIDAVRLRQIKNMLATLFLARGVPMLLGGDEFRRSQQGNNNAYCQDNRISWYDWTLAERNAGLLRFVRRLIALRKAHAVLRAEGFYAEGEILWFGPDGAPPAWAGRRNQLGCVIRGADGGASALCILANATLDRCRFVLPPPAGGRWHVAIDTAAPSPLDISEEGSEPAAPDQAALSLEPRSTVVLLCR
jgi:glycogen operon protein